MFVLEKALEGSLRHIHDITVATVRNRALTAVADRYRAERVQRRALRAVREIVRTARDRKMKVAVMCMQSETAALQVVFGSWVRFARARYIHVCVACIYGYTTYISIHAIYII